MSRLARALAKVAKWVVIGIASFFILVIIGGNIFRLIGRAQLESDFDPAGQLISIGTHRMHLNCVGAGQPTVVLEAPGFTHSVIWEPVLRSIAPLTRVCAYDRSGMGWSERGPSTPTADSRLAELTLLLEESAESPPYLLVGASMGASISWRYAQSHLDDVVGLVTVDGMPRDFANLKSLGMNTIDGPVLSFLLLGIERLGITPLLYGPPPPAEELSPTQSALEERERFLSTGFFGELLSIDSIVRSATTMGSLDDLPLIVIVRGQPGTFFDPLGERKDEAEALWPGMQAEMADLSAYSELRVAERSDHGIALRQPEIVVAAIRDLVAIYRGGGRLPSARRPF